MEQQMATQNKLNGTFGENSMLSQDFFFVYPFKSFSYIYYSIQFAFLWDFCVCNCVDLHLPVFPVPFLCLFLFGLLSSYSSFVFIVF